MFTFTTTRIAVDCSGNLSQKFQHLQRLIPLMSAHFDKNNGDGAGTLCLHQNGQIEFRAYDETTREQRVAILSVLNS